MGGVMKYTWIVVIVFILMLLPISSLQIKAKDKVNLQLRMQSWEARIDAYADGGHTYCIIGEKADASNGVDQFDVPHPPFQPPGRAFIFIRQVSFPQPYNSLWMEWRYYPSNYQSWNLTTFLCPMGNYGTNILLQWNIQQFKLSGYKTISLIYNGQIINMVNTDSFTFYSEPYHVNSMQIVCNRMTQVKMSR